MDFKISLALHLIGIVMWFGSHLVLTRVMAGVFAGEERPASLFKMVRRAFLGFGVGGLGLTLITGVYQLLSRGIPYYMIQGWFHGKLTLVVIMIVVSGVLGVQVNRSVRGEAVNPGVLMALHGATGVVLFGAIFATILGR